MNKLEIMRYGSARERGARRCQWVGPENLLARCFHWSLLILLLTVLVACSEEKAPPRPEKPELRIGWYLWPGWYPMAIAIDRDLFAKQGLRVKPTLYSSYTTIFNDFAAGQLDMCFGGLYELLKINRSGMRVVLVTDTSDGAEGLVVLPSITSPAGLAGARIGIQGGLSGSEFIITSMLRRNGLTRSDVTFVHVEPETVLEQMGEKIQGGYTWDPYLSKAVEKGYRILFTTADTPGMVPDVVAVHGRVAKEREEEMRAFLRVWFEAVEWWRNHPKEAAASIARVTGLQESEISLQGCRLFSLEDNHAALGENGKGGSLHDIARQQTEFILGMGDAVTVADPATVLDPSFLPARSGSK